MGLIDALTAAGLEVSTATEITAYLNTGLQGIYGTGINTDSNSPDGQLIGILTQLNIDLRELLLSINSGFDPDQAQGVILDQRVAINNITREGGTYTIQPISITVNATVTLAGLDANFNSPTATGYTVQDGAGNQFILENTITLTSGTTVCNFRAALIGNVSVPINTITNPVTIVPGVTVVNNPSAAVTVGQNEETDAQLRVRRQQSPAINTTGFLPGLQGKLLNLSGVTEAVVYQNNTESTDGNGTPRNTIWVIVAGGSSADIGNTIYNTINGAGMRGAVTDAIITPSGAVFTAKWDVPIAETLYIKFNIQPTVSGSSFNAAAIAASLAGMLSYGIGGYAETSLLTADATSAVAANGGGGVVLALQISIDNSTWVNYLTTTSPQYQFTVAAMNIGITVL